MLMLCMIYFLPLYWKQVCATNYGRSSFKMLAIALDLQRKPFAFELFFCLEMRGSSHLAQKHVA